MITLRSRVLDVFNKDPDELISIDDVLKEFGEKLTAENRKRIDNILRGFRLKKIIHRHKDKDINGDFQFAIKLDDKYIEVLEVGKYKTKKDKSQTHKKNKLLSKKEIQSMFAAQYNTLAKLEDEVMKIVETSEMTEIEMARIRKFVGR